jgi:hypothetical protein
MAAASASPAPRLSVEHVHASLVEQLGARYANRLTGFARYYTWAINRTYGQGNGCRPSVRDAAAALGLSERTIKRYNADARRLGLLIVGPDARRR